MSLSTENITAENAVAVHPWDQSNHVKAWAPLRVVARLTAALAWTGACYVAVRAAQVVPGIPKKRIARAWCKGFGRLTGMRLKQIGAVPATPYFLVINHISWIDLFAMYSLCDAIGVMQEEDESFPILGTIFKALNPIFVKRRRENIPKGNQLITEAIARGENVMMAPEGVVGPGRVVRRFHAAFLQPAVDAGKPVHYAAISARTPDGCPPASKAVLFGPDPMFRTPDGKIPQSELDAWGPERSFFLHLLGMLSLPSYEVSVHFSPTPIVGTDRETLAQDLQNAVQQIFVPVV